MTPSRRPPFESGHAGFDLHRWNRVTHRRAPQCHHRVRAATRVKPKPKKKDFYERKRDTFKFEKRIPS